LLTKAVSPLVAVVCSDIGGAELKATEIAGGGVVVTELAPPPHPTSAEIVAMQTSSGRILGLIVTSKSP
jgi:hypothetical protein